MDDREPLKQGRCLENIKGKLCADKGYIGQALFENLFLNGCLLYTSLLLGYRIDAVGLGVGMKTSRKTFDTSIDHVIKKDI